MRRDLLVEMDQAHHGTITKDRTGKFQDETIDKPGEDFGAVLYEWLASGTGNIQATSTSDKSEQPPIKPEKPQSDNEEGKSNKPPSETKSPILRVQCDEVINEIATIITVSKDGADYFTENEKEEARKIIRKTRLDEKGLAVLEDFKLFLSDELSKRESKKAA